MAEVLHLQESEDLVIGAFCIQLQLGMLVGDPQGLHRGLAQVHPLPGQGQVFAQALRPQLGVPVAHQLQGIGVGHHHGDAGPPVHADVHQAGLQQRRVLPHVPAEAAGVHGCCALQHAPDVDAAHGSRQQAHRAEFGEAAPHPIRDVEGLVALPLGDLDQMARGPGGGGDDVLLVLLSHRLLQQVQYDQVLAHGLRRAAGFGDHVETGGGGIDRQQRAMRSGSMLSSMLAWGRPFFFGQPL